MGICGGIRRVKLFLHNAPRRDELAHVKGQRWCIPENWMGRGGIRLMEPMTWTQLLAGDLIVGALRPVGSLPFSRSMPASQLPGSVHYRWYDHDSTGY